MTIDTKRGAEPGDAMYRGMTAIAAAWLVALVWVKWAHPAANGGTAEPVALALMLLLCLFHCWLAYRGRATAAFFALAMLLSFALEASSIANGFPFGFYVHNVAAPKLLGVPGVVPLSYAFLAYLSWSIACTILRAHDAGPLRTFGAPLLAALVMPGYDLAVDPIGSTVGGAWSYAHPSGYLGVPLSNFLGWIVTSWAICQATALAFAAMGTRSRVGDERIAFHLVPALVWIALALQYVVDWGHAPAGTVATAGNVFVVAQIFESSVIVALLAMLPPAVAAAIVALAGGRDAAPTTGGA